MITYPWATRCPIFSQIEATFWLGFPFFFHYQEERGSTHWWGPGGGGSANDTLTHPADVLQIKIKSFSTDGRRQKMEFFPADVLPRKYVQKFSDRCRHLKHNKFFGWFGKTLWPLEKSCRRPSEKILTKILIYMSSCEGFVIFQATCKNFMIYPKNGQKMNFTSFYTHKSFDPKYFKR